MSFSQPTFHQSTSHQSTQRQLRVGEEIRHLLSMILQRGAVAGLPLDSALITVTEVRVSPDLSLATAFVVPLGGGEATTQCVRALNACAKAVRHALAKCITLRRVPALRFRVDTQFESSARLEDVLRQARVRDQEVDGEDVVE